MALPGLLIEYLITGACALLWGWYAVDMAWPTQPLKLETLQPEHSLIALPLAYVAGLLVDYVGRLVATLGRLVVADRINGVVAVKLARIVPVRLVTLRRFLRRRRKGHRSISQAKLWLKSAELGRQYEMRSSRDRVARGLFGNTVLATLALNIFRSDMPPVLAATLNPFAVTLALLSFAMWYRLNALTEKFRSAAAAALTDAAGTRQKNDSARFVIRRSMRQDTLVAPIPSTEGGARGTIGA
jgi:hypothetical protein